LFVLRNSGRKTAVVRMRSVSPPPRSSSSWTTLQTQSADADIFVVEIVFDALMSALAAEARFLDAAKRRFRRGDQPFVDADHAVFQPLHHAERAAEIAGVEIAGKAVFGVVRQRDRFFLGLEAEHRRDRSENFLLHEAHLRRSFGDHGGLEERTAKFMALAARNDLRALADRVRDQFLDLLDGIAVDQRALLHAAVEARTDLQLLRCRCKL